jgi:Family of unknown function (DUF695)
VSSTAVDIGKWGILSVSAEEGDAVFRIRTDRPADARLADFSTSVRIQWPYAGDAIGFPEAADQEWMNRFEDRLEDLNWCEGLSYLMLVTTGLNLKEWLFYTTEHEAFMSRFNEVVQGLPRFPLEIAFIPDADWEQWESVRQHAGQAD